MKPSAVRWMRLPNFASSAGSVRIASPVTTLIWSVFLISHQSSEVDSHLTGSSTMPAENCFDFSAFRSADDEKRSLNWLSQRSSPAIGQFGSLSELAVLVIDGGLFTSHSDGA